MDYKNMTDDEFFSLIEERYGKEWSPKDLDSELYKEYVRRISTGV